MSRSATSRGARRTVSSDSTPSGRSPTRVTSSPPCGAIAGRRVDHAGTSSAQAPRGQQRQHAGRALLGLLALRLDAQLRAHRGLVRVGDARELLDLAGEGLGVQTLHVAAGALVDRRVDVHEHELPVLLDQLARLLAGLLVGRDGGHDGDAAEPGEAAGDPADALDVGVAVLLGEAEALGQVRAHHVAVERLDEQAAAVELEDHDVRDRRLARAGEAGEPEGEAAAPRGRGLGMLVRVDVLSHSTPLPQYSNPHLARTRRGCRTPACRSPPNAPRAPPRRAGSAGCTGCSRSNGSRSRGAGCTGSRSLVYKPRLALRSSLKAGELSRRLALLHQ